MAKKPRNAADMPISVSLILSLARTILKDEQAQADFITYCEKHEIELWMSQQDIDAAKRFLVPSSATSRFSFSPRATTILSRDLCKEK